MSKFNVLDYKRRLSSFHVEKNISKAVKEGAWQIIDLNKINLAKGLNSKGRLVGTYSVVTQNYARKGRRPNESKKAGTTYNFNWTGAFINGIFITYKNDKISFSSTGLGLSKKNFFILSNDLLGVEKNRNELINYDILAPRLRRYFKTHIGK